jgi:hypothetical protein
VFVCVCVCVCVCERERYIFKLIALFNFGKFIKIRYEEKRV